MHDLYLEGYEVVMIVMDYIKRFNATENFRDQRHFELGAIVDEMSIVAKRYGIPVVTGMQLNRGAYEKFQTAIEKGDTGAIKKLGASDAGESINVFENADCVVFQGRVPIASVNRLYLTMTLGKMRGKRASNLSFLAQPFDVDEHGDTNEMRLQEDALLPARQYYGVKELGDGVAKEYDANSDAQGHDPGTSREERSTARSGAVLNSPPRKGGRNSAPKKRAAAPIPEDAGAATVEEEPDGISSLGIEGLEVPAL